MAGNKKRRKRKGKQGTFVRFALKALRNGTHGKKIVQAFAYAEEMQDRAPKSRTYGNFKWYWKQEAPHDLNAAEFCMLTGLLWMLSKISIPLLVILWIHWKFWPVMKARTC